VTSADIGALYVRTETGAAVVGCFPGDAARALGERFLAARITWGVAVLPCCLSTGEICHVEATDPADNETVCHVLEIALERAEGRLVVPGDRWRVLTTTPPTVLG
jgi:hypothetical protein